MRERAAAENRGTVGLPGWESLIAFVGLIVSAPQSILDCANVCRELSIRAAAGADATFDKRISNHLKTKSRIRQFSAGLGDYLVEAGALPKDLAKRMQSGLFEV